MHKKPSARRALAAAALGLLAASAQAELIIGLTTTNALFSFDSATPANGSALSFISGLALNERMLAIDLRPSTGVIYGLSSDDRVYSLTTGGAATFIGALLAPNAQLGSDVVGFDFNPEADRTGATSLRIVSSTGQNIAFNVAAPATLVATTAVQAGFASAAYSNNDLNPATPTSLFYIDTTADLLKVTPSGFNNPVITTVGALGFNANGVNGFDISGLGTAYAAMTDADTGKSGLYTINLATGAANFVGAIGIGGNTAIAPALLGLTVAVIPEPQTYALMLAGLGAIGFMARRRRQG